MKKLVLLIFFVILNSLTSTSSAHSYKINNIIVGHPYSLESNNINNQLEIYMTIFNAGNSVEKLIKASVDNRIAKTVQLFDKKNKKEVESIEISAGQALSLYPDGIILNIDNPKQEFYKGNNLEILLNFKEAGTLKVSVIIE